MRNQLFHIILDQDTGCITQITNPTDTHQMNWCSDLAQWGSINIKNRIASEYHDRLHTDLTLVDFREENDFSSSVYENDRYRITVIRSFRANGHFVETYTIKNCTATVLCVNRDNFGIAVPFNDKYTYADDCMTNRCNTHIWCGRNVSWINAMKMGDSDINLGLMLTKGSLVSYSQYDCESNVRGYFELEPQTVLLNAGDEYTIQWELFWHTGKADFQRKLSAFENYIHIDAEHYTLFEGEPLRFRVFSNHDCAPKVFCGEKEIAVQDLGDCFAVSFIPEKRGKHVVFVSYGDITTCTEFLIKLPFKDLVEKRIHYIVDHQQWLDESSPLYGAYLVYDNQIQSPYFDYFNTDHNACRERMNMALAIIKYLQHHENEKVKRSIELYIQFLYREFFEETTGEVFNNISKSRDALRLYNAPGVMLIFTEMYCYTKDEKYLDSILMLAKKYYSIGGEKCYSNAVAVKKTYHAFVTANRLDDAEIIKEFFGRHTQNMMNNGTSYPAHEVNYEQTIVTPTVNCLSQYGALCQDKEQYIQHAKMHVECLDRFIGHQPSYHLNEVSIRYWDDFWFGKSKKFGDTLPQHLSCLSARAFISYSELTGKTEYLKRAENCIRNCMCLIGDNGTGSASYVYPHYVNGKKGEFYDEWANDQDLVIYDALDMKAGYPQSFEF